MSDPLVDYLRGCCVHILGDQPACGFFITPNLVVTCSHVVGRRTLEDCTEIKLEKWEQEQGLRPAVAATLLRNFPEHDIAFIETTEANPAYALLSEEDDTRSVDNLTALGFPEKALGNPMQGKEIVFEEIHGSGGGPTQVPHDWGLVKFSQDLVEEGFSGGPVLNLNTCQVIGVLRLTMDDRIPLGGWAVDARTVKRLLNQIGVNLPRPTQGWMEAAEKQRQRPPVGVVPQIPLSPKQTKRSEKWRLRQFHPLNQERSRGLYLSIQFPIADLRPLLGIETLPIPRWRSGPRVNEEFVHFFGEVRRRTKGVPAKLPWRDEVFYATAKRALTFPILEKNTIGRFAAPQGGCRALYHDGKKGVVNRVETGIALPLGKTEILEPQDLHVALRDFLSLTINVARLKSLECNGFEGVRVRDVIQKPLVMVGDPLARLFQIASTRVGTSVDSHTVRAGEPLVFVLYEGIDVKWFAQVADVIDSTKVNNAAVYYDTFKSHGRVVQVWYIDLDSADGYSLRRLRIALSRLHAERQAMLDVLRAYKDHVLDANSEMIGFLKERLGWLSKPSQCGIDSSTIHDITSVRDILCSRDERDEFEKRIAEIRNEHVANTVRAFLDGLRW